MQSLSKVNYALLLDAAKYNIGEWMNKQITLSPSAGKLIYHHVATGRQIE